MAKDKKFKLKTNYLMYIVISILCAFLVQLITIQIFSKKIISRTIVTVDTSKIIEAYNYNILEESKTGVSGENLFNKFSIFINELKNSVDSLSEKLNVIVVERGAVVSSDVYDLTDLIVQDLNEKKYNIDFNKLKTITDDKNVNKK
jgi:hypothetical protein